MGDQHTYNCPVCGKPTPNPIGCGCTITTHEEQAREFLMRPVEATGESDWVKAMVRVAVEERVPALAELLAQARERGKAAGVVEGLRLAADQMEKGLAGHTRSARNTLISRARNLRALADEREGKQ